MVWVNYWVVFWVQFMDSMSGLCFAYKSMESMDCMYYWVFLKQLLIEFFGGNCVKLSNNLCLKWFFLSEKSINFMNQKSNKCLNQLIGK